MSRPSAEQGFAFSREQFQQILEDTLAQARRLGASDAGAEVSEGVGLSVSVQIVRISEPFSPLLSQEKARPSYFIA